MLKIVFSITIIAIAGIFVSVESGVLEALLTFLLSGAIPGTSLTISPNLMMVGLGAIAWLVLVRMTALGTLNIVTVRRLIAQRQQRNERMPKRRFGLIPSNLDR